MVAQKTTKPLTFDRAYRRMPKCLDAGFDHLAQTTVADLWWHARHELDLHEEGEDNDILNNRDVASVKRYMAWIKANAPEAFL